MIKVDEKIRKILKDFFDKYDAPKTAIDGATAQIVQILNNPVQAKYGAFVMTEAASFAADRKDRAALPQSKPQEI